MKEGVSAAQAPQKPWAIKFQDLDAATRFYLEFKNSVPFRIDGLLTIIFPTSPETALAKEPETRRILKELEAKGLAREVPLTASQAASRPPTGKEVHAILKRFAEERPGERAFIERLRLALGERPESTKEG